MFSRIRFDKLSCLLTGSCYIYSPLRTYEIDFLDNIKALILYDSSMKYSNNIQNAIDFLKRLPKFEKTLEIRNKMGCISNFDHVQKHKNMTK